MADVVDLAARELGHTGHGRDVQPESVAPEMPLPEVIASATPNMSVGSALPWASSMVSTG